MKTSERVRTDSLLLSAIAAYMLNEFAWRTLDGIYDHLATHTEVRGVRGLPNALCTLNTLRTPSERKSALATVLTDMVTVKALEVRSISKAWRAARHNAPASVAGLPPGGAPETLPHYTIDYSLPSNDWDIDDAVAQLNLGPATVCSIQRCLFDWAMAVKEAVHVPLDKIVDVTYIYVWSVGVGVPGMPLRFHYGHTIRNAFERARACHAGGYVPPGVAAPPRPNHL